MTTFSDPRSDGVIIEAFGGTDVTIDFEYEQPDVTVETGTRYTDHEVIGGITVRQKIGEEPMRVDLNGICTRDEARNIDELRNADYVEFDSYRTGTVMMQVEGTETSPYAEGGAVAVNNGSSDMVYEFAIQLTEA